MLKLKLDEKVLMNWEEIEEAFENLHELPGEYIDTLDEWEKFHHPTLGENRVYEEDLNASEDEYYSFGKVPVFQDQLIIYVEEENGEYYITDHDGNFFSN